MSELISGKAIGTSINDELRKEVEQLKMIETILPMVSKLIMIVLVIGAVKYYLKQKKDHKKNFKNIKFFFGTTVCDSLK